MSDDFNATVLMTLAELKQHVVQLVVDQTLLRKEVGSTRADIGSMRAEIVSMRADIMERVDRLQDALTKTREDITVNMGAVDRVWRAFAFERDAVEGLREAVTVLQRKVHRLADQQPQ